MRIHSAWWPSTLAQSQLFRRSGEKLAIFVGTIGHADTGARPAAARVPMHCKKHKLDCQSALPPNHTVV
jgi:hypothetical protein